MLNNRWSGLLKQEPAEDDHITVKEYAPPSLPDHGLPVDFDVQFLEVAKRIPQDENIGLEFLNIINSYLEDNRPLPYGIREYLYRAFKATIAAKSSKRATVLASYLGISRDRKRPLLANSTVIGELVEKYIKESISKTQSIAKVAEEKALSNSTVRGHYKIYKEDQADFAKILELEAKPILSKGTPP